MTRTIWAPALGVALMALVGGPLFAAPGGGGHGAGGGGGHGAGGGGGGGYRGGGVGAVRSYSGGSSIRSYGGSGGSLRATPSYGGYSTARTYAGSPSGSWAHNGWWNNNWGANGHYYGRYGNFYGYGSWWGLGLYGYWNPWWYSDVYPYSYYNYYPYYAYDAAMYGYPADSAAQPYAYTAGQPYPYTVAPTAAIIEPSAAQQPNESTSSEGEQFAERALDAFHQGNYRESLRLAGHAAIDMPRNARVHELMSLALFSLKDYRGAAMEAHAAVALGPISDWAQLYSYYGDLDAYTKPLDALVDYVRKNPASAEGRFLLAYHDLMMGHNPEGKVQLAQVIKLVPQDKVAEQLMLQLGGTSATTAVPPAPPAPSSTTSGTTSPKPATKPLSTSPPSSPPQPAPGGGKEY